MKLAMLLDLLILAFAALALAACAGPSISPDQLAAVAKDNASAAVGCATGTGPWGRAGVVYVNAAQASQISGTVNVNTDCSVNIQSNGGAAPPPAK